MPSIGRLPTLANVYIGCGNGCWGICQGPAVGAILCDLICGLEQRLGLDLEPFSPNHMLPLAKHQRKKGWAYVPAGEER